MVARLPSFDSGFAIVAGLTTRRRQTMKISMQEVGRILQTQSVSGYDNRPSGNAAGVTGAGYAPAAEVEISANAQVVRQAASYVEDAPDVREDVVQALK